MWHLGCAADREEEGVESSTGRAARVASLSDLATTPKPTSPDGRSIPPRTGGIGARVEAPDRLVGRETGVGVSRFESGLFEAETTEKETGALNFGGAPAGEEGTGILDLGGPDFFTPFAGKEANFLDTSG